ncbi:MAG: caspase family protein [Bacteroidota bacterium]
MINKHILLIIISIFVLLGEVCFCQNPELTIQTGHSSEITAFAFSKDGKYLASAAKDNIIIIWDFNQSKQLKVLKGHHQKINSICFLNNGCGLISAGDDGKIIYWDIKKGEILHSVNIGKEICSLDISKDDKYLVAAGYFPQVKLWIISDELNFYKDITAWDKDSTVYLKSVIKKAKNEGPLIKENLVPVCISVVFNPSSDEIFVARAVKCSSNHDYDSYCDINKISLSTGLVQKMNIESNRLFCSSGSQNLYISTIPSRIIKWDLNRNKKLYTRPGSYRNKDFRDISVNANDSILAAVNEDGIIYLWKTSGYYLRTSFQPDNIFTAALFNPVKKDFLVAGNNKGDISIIDVKTGKAIKKLESGVYPLTCLAVNKNDNILAVAGENNVITTFSLGNGIRINSFAGHSKKISGLDFISDSILVSVASDNLIYFWNTENDELKKMKGNNNPFLLNAVINSPIYSLFLNPLTSYLFAKKYFFGHHESLDAITTSSSGKLMATGGKCFNKGILYNMFVPRIFPVHIIDCNKMKKTGKIKAHYRSINSLSFNSKETVLATTGKDNKAGTVKIFEIEKNNINFLFFLTPLASYQAYMVFRNYSLKNPYPEYNSLKIWNTSNNKLIKTFDIPLNIKSLLFSPVNDTILFTDEEDNLIIFDYKTDTAKKLIKGKAPLMFNSDGKSIYFQDDQNSVIQWDIDNQKTIMSYSGHSDSISSAVLFSDGKRMATVSFDGSVKIWDVKTGKEIATMYAINSEDFIIKTPDYYYYSTKNAKKEIGFTFGIKFYPFEQFDLQYNRPDIVLSRLGCASEEVINSFHQAYIKRLKKTGFSEDSFVNDFHISELTVENADNLPLSVHVPEFSFTVNAEDSKYLIDRINVWINDVSIYGTNGLPVREEYSGSVSKKISTLLSYGINKIRISCLNEKGVESLKETIEIIYAPLEKEKPDLYIIAIGASEYDDKQWNFTYAAKDAFDFSLLFENQKSNYNEIYVTKILNSEVTLDNILKSKEILMKSKVDDKVLLFYAGHGLIGENFDYYLATYNIDFDNPSKNGLKYEELQVLLDSIPAREKILFIDACHSGELDDEDGEKLVVQNTDDKNVVFRGAKPRDYNSKSIISYSNSFELMKELFSDLRKGTGAVVISSAGGGEFAFEGKQWNNGVFTYSLREGIISGFADKNKDEIITVSELKNYMTKRVLILTNGLQKPTMREENIENDFVIWKK